MTLFCFIGDVDNTPPTLTFCPNDVIASAPSGQTFVQVSWELPTATDNSGTARLESGEPFGLTANQQFFGVGMTNLVNAIYTFTDPAGNEAICRFRIGALGKCCVDNSMDIVIGLCHRGGAMVLVSEGMRPL